MPTYFLTAFDKKGEKLLDETFEAATDEEAKQTGEQMLSEKDLSEHTHRCVSPNGKLVLFHS
ncbi:YhzD family protein [Bacillus tianshenii]|nr:YhzD family protein [Bacillus tianshenii]